MKKPPFLALLAVGALALAGARVASAQEQTILAHVPFAFDVNGHAMPAGDYQVVPDPDMQSVLQIVSRDGRSVAFTIYESVTDGTGITSPSFQFKKVGGEAVLWRVNMPGRVVAELPLKASGSETKLAARGAEKVHRGDD